jgi:hypothetical protein
MRGRCFGFSSAATGSQKSMSSTALIIPVLFVVALPGMFALSTLKPLNLSQPQGAAAKPFEKKSIGTDPSYPVYVHLTKVSASRG